MYILQLEARLWREAGCHIRLSLSVKLPQLLEEQKTGVLLVIELLLNCIFWKPKGQQGPRGPFLVLYFVQLCPWNRLNCGVGFAI